MTYKLEIDGLRAIAVMLVLLCHMQLGVSGGFIGVDIFFVISGYLITSSILGDIEKNRFLFWNFYGRRLVRLYPALIVAVFLTFLAGVILSDPVFLTNLARTARYALTSTSNLYFKDNMGYFALGVLKQPFLHTWSLGVEWQFYLLWPFIIFGVLKFIKKEAALIGILLCITLASIYAAHWATIHAAQAGYYLVQYRAYELGIGALLVFAYRKTLSPRASVALTAAGVAAIAYGAWVFTPLTPFPGTAALLPCLGTAACIWGGKGFTTGNILRLAPFVYIGKISYSAYLVHWPLLVFYKYYIFRDFLLIEKIILLVVSLLLGATLYKLVETRINWKRLNNKLRGCLTIIAITLGLTGVLLYTSRAGEGLPSRVAIPELYNSDYQDWGGRRYNFNAILGNPEGQKIAILAGDSFTGNLADGVDRALSNTDQAIQMVFYPGCIISEIDISPQTTAECRQVSTEVIALTNKLNLPLILSQAWGTSILLEERQVTTLSAYKTRETYFQFITENLNDIHTKIGGKPLILIGSVPYRYWGENDQECLLRPSAGMGICAQEIPPYHYTQSPAYEFNEFLKAYAQAHENVFYIEPSMVSCPDEGICTAQRNAMLYYDGFHTSVYGSRVVSTYIVEELRKILGIPATATPVPAVSVPIANP